MKRAGWSFVLGTSCALMFAACGAGPEDVENLEGTESLKMKISLEGDVCGVNAATATVSAPDLPPMYPQALNVGNGYIEGKLTNIPVGSRRLVVVKAYDGRGKEVYAGSTTVDVYSGSMTYAYLDLMRNQQNCPGGGTGNIYIIGTLEGSSGWDAGYDAGPGPGWDAGPGPSYDAGPIYDAGSAIDAG